MFSIMPHARPPDVDLRQEADLGQQGGPVGQDEVLQLRWYQVDAGQGVQVHRST
jgi:hypothetical protein